MKKMLTLVLLLMAQFAMADVFPYPLNCAGTYDENSGSWVHEFDFDMTFTEITQVSIRWSGRLRAAAITPPFQYVDVGVRASIASTPLFSRASVWAGANTYPDPEEFDCESIIQSSGTTTDWSSLLDGKGEIHIGYTEQIFVFQTYLHHGHVILDNAVLIIEGTAIPEPIGTTMLLVGTIVLMKKK